MYKCLCLITLTTILPLYITNSHHLQMKLGMYYHLNTCTVLILSLAIQPCLKYVYLTVNNNMFSKSDTPILFDNLDRPLDFGPTDSSLWDDKCDYYEINDVHNLNPNNKNLTILQLNIRGLLGKQSDLSLMLDKLYSNNSLPKILLLSETHLTESKL